MIQILTDSCSDLSPTLLEQHNIQMVSLSVFINNQTYRDRIDLNTPTLFSLVEKFGELPKTSAPAVNDFIAVFEQAPQSIFIGISSKLSATLNNAQIAASSLENHTITIIDSLNLSTGIGLLALKAAEMRKDGASAEEIILSIHNTLPKVHASFVIDTLDYLYKGGRCSAMALVVGSLLKIRPIIEVRPDGTLAVREKITGSRKKALDSLLADFKRNLPTLDLHRVFITHTGCDQDAEYLANQILSLAPVEHLDITIAGATIASHCGPNTIGILYMTQ